MSDVHSEMGSELLDASEAARQSRQQAHDAQQRVLLVESTRARLARCATDEQRTPGGKSPSRLLDLREPVTTHELEDAFAVPSGRSSPCAFNARHRRGNHVEYRGFSVCSSRSARRRRGHHMDHHTEQESNSNQSGLPTWKLQVGGPTQKQGDWRWHGLQRGGHWHGDRGGARRTHQ
ncbi:hypothetical protein PHYPSEUDO_007788 [Phytophthora pseudosyringae]|uniref:Uncharacterized protein n=1 Tax=Phytophthora pseudosyringae TaxID=221518 RepID=A0A8T1VFR3_9STRA|nr:hypothetical protein PHYPSEUDO_007788 [Phytophthora pseudosyringae]